MHRFLAFSIIVFAVIIVSVSAYAAFERNLRWGNNGSDVLALQKFLNQDPDTRLALTGPGSPGAETTYFGPITHAAVIKFQEKYVTEVLIPVGLTKGTGFFGPSTRAQIVRLTSVPDPPPPTATNTITITSTTTQTEPPEEPEVQVPHIESILPASGPDGTKITIKGTNLSLTNNTIVASYGTFTGVPSYNGTTIILTVSSPIPEVAKRHILPLTFYFAVEVGENISNFEKFIITQ